METRRWSPDCFRLQLRITKPKGGFPLPPIRVPDKITIKVDNNQAKVFANDETISSRLRTAFSLKEAWVQEIKDAGEVSVVQIPADINVSDMLTKVQPGTKVKRYIDLINPIKINRRQQVEDPEGM